MNGIPQDGPERLRYIASVAIAEAEGATMQSAIRGADNWRTCNAPLRPAHQWAEYDYRVAPKAPRVCKASYYKELDDPWRNAYPLSETESCSCEFVPLIELTAEVRAALASAGIDYEGKEAV